MLLASAPPSWRGGGRSPHLSPTRTEWSRLSLKLFARDRVKTSQGLVVRFVPDHPPAAIPYGDKARFSGGSRRTRRWFSPSTELIAEEEATTTASARPREATEVRPVTQPRGAPAPIDRRAPCVHSNSHRSRRRFSPFPAAFSSLSRPLFIRRLSDLCRDSKRGSPSLSAVLGRFGFPFPGCFPLFCLFSVSSYHHFLC